MLVYSDNNGTWFEIGSYYSGFYRNNTNDNIPASSDVYYILNFNNILTSFGNISFILAWLTCIYLPAVTLFVLMVVNNWYIIMVSDKKINNYLLTIVASLDFIIHFVGGICITSPCQLACSSVLHQFLCCDAGDLASGDILYRRWVQVQSAGYG